MSTATIPIAGLGYSLAASILFGLTPWYIQWLHPLSGMTLFWNRILFSTIIALLFLLYRGQWTNFRKLMSNRRELGYLVAGTPIVAIQWWLFVWAPINGMTKELSLGYFLLPLTLVITGRWVYQETVRPLQKLAIAIACIGIFHELLSVGQLSWVPFMVAGVYPFYFILRKKVSASTPSCFLLENLLLLPAAVLFLSLDSTFINTVTASPAFTYLLPGLGILSTSAMLVYVTASRLLPVSLFGLLGYVEPALIFAVAVLVIGEPVSDEQWLTYGFIGLASIMITIDSARMITASGSGSN